MNSGKAVKTSANYILIDGGYFVHYRYYSMCTWWRLAKQQCESDEPFENDRFRTKFSTTFNTALQQLPSKLGISGDDITTLVATDCPKQTIWRNDHISNYKGTRKSCCGVRCAFDLISKEGLLDRHTVLQADRLEADDCIAIAVQEIRAREPHANIWIITSDMDFLQLASDRTNLVDLKFKPLKTWYGDPAKDLFCKIVAGDKSDNIPSVFPRCGVKTAANYYEDRVAFERKLEEVESAKERYERNALVIDFTNIPKELSSGIRTQMRKKNETG